MAQGHRVDQRQPSPTFEDRGSWQTARAQRPQLRNRSAVARHGDAPAGLDAIDHLATAIPQIPDRHGLHGRHGITGDTPRNAVTELRGRRGQDPLDRLGDRGLELALVEPGVGAAGGDELVVVALLDDRAVLHDEDAVGVPDRREPVGDHERGPPVE